MKKIVFTVSTGHLGEPGHSDIFALDSSSSSLRPPWWFFCAWQGTSYAAVNFVVLSTTWSCSKNKHFLCHVSLVFTASFAEIQSNVEPNSVLELNWIF